MMKRAVGKAFGIVAVLVFASAGSPDLKNTMPTSAPEATQVAAPPPPSKEGPPSSRKKKNSAATGPDGQVMAEEKNEGDIEFLPRIEQVFSTVLDKGVISGSSFINQSLDSLM